MANLCFCCASAAFSESLLCWSHLIISRVEFQRVGTSCTRDSSVSPWETCRAFSSAVFAGLCLKCPTILRHLAKTLSNPLSRKATAITLCITCATQGICSNGKLLAAAIILGALSVPIVVTLSVISHSFATLRNWLAHASAKCLSSVFNTPKVNECRCQLSSIRCAVTPR